MPVDQNCVHDGPTETSRSDAAPSSTLAAVPAARHGQTETVSDADELLTAKDLAKMLRISVKTIYSYAERGLLPSLHIQSNVRFRKSEIVKWMAEHPSRRRFSNSGKR